MKLFIKEHLWIVLLYVLTFIGLATLYDTMNGFEHGIGYFIFLTLFLLGCFLLYRYVSMNRLYRKLSAQPRQLDDLLIPNARSSLEMAFSEWTRQYRGLLHIELRELQLFHSEYRIMLNHWVHQMKTPVSVISLLTQTHEGHPDFAKVGAEARRLDYNLSQLLTFLRLDDFRKDVRIDHIQLKPLVGEVVNELKPFFIARSIFPKVIVPEEWSVHSDTKWLKNVLYQIINNAVKYGDRGTSVLISATESLGRIELAITNEGMGIKKSDIRRIFDKFYTGENGRRFGESTGLGLYMVRTICSLLEHGIEVESEPGKLTTFTITFKP